MAKDCGLILSCGLESTNDREFLPNKLTQDLLDFLLFFFIDHFAAVGPCDVDGVHRRALFRADAGVHSGKPELSDG